MKNLSALKKVGLLSFALVALSLFQNCSGGFSARSYESPSNSQLTSTDGTGDASSPLAPPQSLSACLATVQSVSSSTTGSGFNLVERIGEWNYQPVYPSQSSCAQGEGTIYNVGPGKDYSSPNEVPWLNLKGCDVVNIHYRAAAYKDIIYFSSRGEKNKWIIVRGIAGPNGEKPVFDGNNAVMPTGSSVNTNVDAAGLFIVFKPAGVGSAYEYKPGYLQIDGFRFQNARAPAVVTTKNGNTRAWGGFSAGIYIAGADYVAITNNELTDNGLGLFANSTDAGNALQTIGLLVRGNYFHNNGNTASFSEHNSYTEGLGTVYEYNYFGPTLEGSYGDNIKERSAGVVFRYNFIEGGANMISLRDPESNGAYESEQKDVWNERMVTAVFIYSNIFFSKSQQSIMIGHGDGSHGSGKQYREGKIYFYHNRVVARVDNSPFWADNVYYEKSGVPLFALSNTRAATTVVARNNLFDIRSFTDGRSPAAFGIFYYQGLADFDSNWINSDFLSTVVVTKPADSLLAVGNMFNGAGLSSLVSKPNENPGFVNESANDFRTTSNSPYAQLKAELPDAVNKRCLMPVADPVVRH